MMMSTTTEPPMATLPSDAAPPKATDEIGGIEMVPRTGISSISIPTGEIEDYLTSDPREDLVGEGVGHQGVTEDHEEVVMGPLDGHPLVHEDDLIDTSG